MQILRKVQKPELSLPVDICKQCRISFLMSYIYIYISNHRNKNFAYFTRFEILLHYFRLLGKILDLLIELLYRVTCFNSRNHFNSQLIFFLTDVIVHELGPGFLACVTIYGE